MLKNSITFAVLFGTHWGISSVGLEHLPCTQGVKGSSPLFSTKSESLRFKSLKFKKKILREKNKKVIKR